eukprot:2719416-Pyramimonas_sp.AAC.1
MTSVNETAVCNATAADAPGADFVSLGVPQQCYFGFMFIHCENVTGFGPAIVDITFGVGDVTQTDCDLSTLVTALPLTPASLPPHPLLTFVHQIHQMVTRIGRLIAGIIRCVHTAPSFLFPWHSASAAVECVYIVDGDACQHKVLTPETRALTVVGPEE